MSRSGITVVLIAGQVFLIVGCSRTDEASAVGY